MKPAGIGAAVILLLLVSSSLAQTQSTGSTTSNAAKPAVASDNIAVNTNEKKPPKKVWTNDEIGSVHGAISVVGDERSSSVAGEKKQPGTTAAGEARQQQIANYRKQIQQFQAQIDSIDKRIAQLKNFKGENTSPSAGINPYGAYNMVPVEEQVKQLEEKKKQLQKKIEDTEVEAQKNGIDPGDLR